jgi:hypothetical protein
VVTLVVKTTRTPAHSRHVVRDLPNFRDAGRTVDTPLLRLVGRLQAKFGRAFVSERSLRAMLFEDTALMAGVSTLPKALTRLGAQGLVVQVWLVAGQILPDGSACTHGARLIWCPQNRRQKKSAAAHNAKQDRRIGERNRLVPVGAASALLGKLAAGKALAPVERVADEHLARREAAKAALAELAALWQREGKKPPD